jgi:hypothetical protein
VAIEHRAEAYRRSSALATPHQPRLFRRLRVTRRHPGWPTKVEITGASTLGGITVDVAACALDDDHPCMVGAAGISSPGLRPEATFAV